MRWKVERRSGRLRDGELRKLELGSGWRYAEPRTWTAMQTTQMFLRYPHPVPRPRGVQILFGRQSDQNGKQQRADGFVTLCNPSRKLPRLALSASTPVGQLRKIVYSNLMLIS